MKKKKTRKQISISQDHLNMGHELAVSRYRSGRAFSRLLEDLLSEEAARQGLLREEPLPYKQTPGVSGDSPTGINDRLRSRRHE